MNSKVFRIQDVKSACEALMNLPVKVKPPKALPVKEIAAAMGFTQATDPSIRVKLGVTISKWAKLNEIPILLRDPKNPRHSHKLYFDTPELRAVIQGFFAAC